MAASTIQVTQYQRGRVERLSAELTFGIAQIGKAELAGWATMSAKHFGGCMIRRIGNITLLARDIAAGAVGFSTDAVRASQDNRLLDFLCKSAGTAATTAGDAAKAAIDAASKIRRQLTESPVDAVPQLLSTVAASLIVAGGPNADGGAADLDLMFGIGAHRSILSHSIIMGSALEAGIMSVLSLVELVHDKLPSERDPLWDSLHAQASTLADAIKTGAAIGLAYHLFVDGTLQAAPYHDLPVSAPLPVHQGIFVVNAVAEAKSAMQPTGKPSQPRASSQGKRHIGNRASANAKGRDFAQQHGKASQLAHKAYLAVGLVVEPPIARRMSIEHCTLIRRYGVWMQALANGDLEPITLEQHEFVSVAHKVAAAQTPYEVAWRAYELACWQADNT
ncbi:DUF413 domain-containing protein [Paucibacter sp. DJ1R-11]|uniref:DUF413 domain-containing protein n=1 Tax=Paucibacter sp. DJ1R-11 TaxID=2893556 RepID=UPI0021E5031D|nr:DUF413 domain-containing protein [Paucibacter sp. DJ1R-11]MCV2362825.1 DUF413 domain-containing protein [Paucibacter sp. DJ1R-11]